MVKQDELRGPAPVSFEKKTAVDAIARISRIYEPRLNAVNYDLVVIAVPRTPGEIEVSTNIEDIAPVAAVVHAAMTAALEDEANRREKARAILATPDAAPSEQVSEERDAGKPEG